MSVTVQCPTCSQGLLAADDLVGKLASCPHCQTQFPVATSVTQAVSGTPPRETGHPAATSSTHADPGTPIPLAKPLKLRTAPSMLQAEGGAPAPPPPMTQAKVLDQSPDLYPPGRSPKAAAPQSLDHSSPIPQSPVPSSQTHSPAPPPSGTPAPGARIANVGKIASGARSRSARPSREARPARFIPADASATRVELGHDGQLPVLQLEESKRVDTDQQQASASNPWLLVAALIVSFGMSALLLFVDLDSTPTERATKRAARSAIETFYSKPSTQPQRYRKLLREALQANNKGDYATERRRYHQVLDLLHAENNDPLSGLTGQANAAKPPHDRHLEEMLSTLVDD